MSCAYTIYIIMDKGPALNILVVDDDPAIIEILKAQLGRITEIYSIYSAPLVFSASRLSEAEEILSKERIDAVLLDLNLPDAKNAEAVIVLSAVAPSVAIVAITGYYDAQITRDVLEAGAEDFLIKPCSGVELIGRVIVNAVERRKIRARALQSEEKFQHAQRHETVARLAGGVAHDFNNVITAIEAYCRFLEQGLPKDDQCREDIQEIRKATHRAAGLTRQLLSFGRSQPSPPKIVEPDAIIGNLERMLSRTLGEDVCLVIELDAANANILIDPSALEQVVLNLAINARDAMPNGGTLTMRSRQCEGEYLLSVSDTGQGMDMQTRERIFEPYFTTKPTGIGTGLGLASVIGIIKKIAGKITVDSELGAGSTFQIRLPITEEKIMHTADRLEIAAKTDGTPGGTVLLVEDDALVRRPLSQLLDRAGYTVLAASDSAEARDLFGKNIGSIDLLLTDIVMPGENGWDLSQHLLDRRPDLKVIYMSGYTRSDQIDAKLAKSNAPFLPKPFTPDELARTLNGALNP